MLIIVIAKFALDSISQISIVLRASHGINMDGNSKSASNAMKQSDLSQSHVSLSFKTSQSLQTNNNLNSKDGSDTMMKLPKRSKKANSSSTTIASTPMKLNNQKYLYTNYNTPAVTVPPSTVKKANPQHYTVIQDSIQLRKKQLTKVSQSDNIDEESCKSPSLNTWNKMFGSDQS